MLVKPPHPHPLLCPHSVDRTRFISYSQGIWEVGSAVSPV